MPRYDYRCVSCESEFELVQTFAEAGSGTCPACQGAGRRVFHAVPVIYKGSGFYTTDYGRPKPPAENKNGSGDSSSTSGSDSSSDSKESKSDTATKSTSDSSAKSSTESSSASSTPAASG